MLRRLLCFGFLVLFTATIFGQTTENKPAAFESAYVGPSATTIFPQLTGGGAPHNGRYEIRNASMLDLIRTAYGVEAEKIVGGPNWTDSDRFDVVATVPAGTNLATAKIMLQALLADRFKLAVKQDNAPLPVYVLSVGKGGPKLKSSDGAGKTGCEGQPPSGPPQPGVVPYIVVVCRNMTMADFATQVHQMAGGYLDHLVVDSTSLEGSWDFDIKWTGRGQLAAAGPDGISIFDAVDKQLGLKLDLQKQPMPAIIIASVNEKPTDNLPGVAEALAPSPRVEFEAADIKPSAPDSPQQGVGVRYQNGGRITAVGALKDLIGIALQIPPNLTSDLLVGLPKSATTTRWDIVAKTPSEGIGAADHTGGRETAPPISVALMMMRSLLEDRFGLKTHTEEQMASVYGMAQKGDLKLKKPDPTQRAGCNGDPTAVPKAVTVPMIAITCKNTTMAELAKNAPMWAGGYIDHPIVDLSDIPGTWDFSIYWTPRGALDAPRPADPSQPPGAAATALDPGGMSFFEAMEKELGLKLTPQKHTILVTVVDHVEEKPKD